MGDQRETLKKANEVVARKKGREFFIWQTLWLITVHRIANCLARRDRHGAEYNAALQDEIQKEIINLRRW